MRKYHYSTRQCAEDMAERFQNAMINAEIAIGEMLTDGVVWRKSGHLKVGLYRPNGAACGMVIVVWRFPDQHPSCTVQTLDSWAELVRGQTNGDEPDVHSMRKVLDELLVLRQECWNTSTELVGTK